ncbi:hypothetical protein X975_26876, partial [Stegodyphus mimosarum]
MQLWILSRSLCDLWWTRCFRCLLLQRMYYPRKR